MAEDCNDGEFDLSDDTKRDAFLALQFNALRQEIELQISERRKVEAQTFIGLAAIYAWVFSNTANLTSHFLTASMAIPFVFAVLGFLRWAGIMSRIMTLGAYNRQIEEQIVGQTGGWETFLSTIRIERPFLGRLEGIAEATAWTLAIVGTGIVFITTLVGS